MHLTRDKDFKSQLLFRVYCRGGKIVVLGKKKPQVRFIIIRE